MVSIADLEIPCGCRWEIRGRCRTHSQGRRDLARPLRPPVGDARVPPRSLDGPQTMHGCRRGARAAAADHAFTHGCRRGSRVSSSTSLASLRLGALELARLPPSVRVRPPPSSRLPPLASPLSLSSRVFPLAYLRTVARASPPSCARVFPSSCLFPLACLCVELLWTSMREALGHLLDFFRVVIVAVWPCTSVDCKADKRHSRSTGSTVKKAGAEDPSGGGINNCVDSSTEELHRER